MPTVVEQHMGRLVIWGAGELGGRVAKLWTHGSVVGITKTPNRHSTLQAMGVEARVGSAADVLQPEDTLLLAIPGYAAQGEAISQLAQTPSPHRAVLISSTGYYGPNASGLVTTNAPPGSEERPQNIAATEQAFRQWAGETGVVIRFGGLYRPGRGPISPLARRGTASAGPPNKVLALIHYDDAAIATVKALELPAPNSTYIGITLPSPTRQQYYTAACQALELAPPTFTAPLTGPPEFDVTSFQTDLLPQPTHPDWQEAILLS
ncbi:MAG: NAD(P)-binding domain-containing protein [Cyanobacteria bacterium P01_E01_bin.34]